MSKNLEITGTYVGEKYRFENAGGDTVIAEIWCNSDINDTITIKGQADLDELQTDQEYRFYGWWTNYKNKRTGQQEKQFHFTSFVRQQPHTREAVIAYLRQAGEGLGFGAVRAAKLWQEFGSNAVRIMREEPDRAVDILDFAKLRLSLENAQKISDYLKHEQALEGCVLDLTDLLVGRGFPKSTARSAVKLWGNKAAQTIRRNPYLMMKRLAGCGFKRCDALYLDLGKPPAALKRQALCGWYSVASNTEGNTWLPADVSINGIRTQVGGTDVEPERAVRLATRSRWLAETRTQGIHGPISATGDRRWVAEYVKADHEQQLATAISYGLTETPTLWPDVSLLDGIDDHQRSNLAKATAGQIGLLGGSPGTGKTYTASALVKHLVGSLGSQHIAIGCPTGKAAVRVTESLSKYGLTLRARTWHSHLAALNIQGVKHFPYKILIGDESSMCDTDLMAAVFRARSAGAHVLLCGDVNQLPPVGHGAPLRDLIAAGLPYGELREIKRNSGGIVEACAAIRDRRPWTAGDNLVMVESRFPDDQIRQMIAEVRQQITAGRDGIWDVQIVCAVNDKSPLGRKQLNKLLQEELNPNGGQQGGGPFRVSDKIVNTKNAFFPFVEYDSSDPETQTNDRGDVYVANGELAEVIDVLGSLIVAKLSNPTRVIKIPMGKADQGEEQPDGDGANSDKTGTGCSWDLGYALSVHKSQGSEFPVVIVMLDEYPGARMVCSREWLYTAISRAKDRCVLIGKKSLADYFCKRQAIQNRKTLLKERILLECANRELAEM